MTDEQFFSPKAIAGKLNVSEETVRRLIERGELQATRVGNQLRVSESWLQEYIDKNKTRPAPRPRVVALRERR